MPLWACAGAAAKECDTLKPKDDPAGCTCSAAIPSGKQACPSTASPNPACICSSGATTPTKGSSTVTVKNCFSAQISFMTAQYTKANGDLVCTQKA